VNITRQEEREMATTKKKGKTPTKAAKSKDNDCAQYAELRTILDSLEIGAIRFYLDKTTPAEKNQRFEKLRDQLMPIVTEVWGGKKGLKLGCPEGYTNCNGCCVPYDCFGGNP
jgi:hypothetical protein